MTTAEVEYTTADGTTRTLQLASDTRDAQTLRDDATSLVPDDAQIMSIEDDEPII